MKKWLSLLLALCMLATLSGALAESSGTEALSVTHHTAQIAGQTLSYTATTGRMMVEMEGSQAQMFFTDYTLDGVENLDQRPITFAFSGGPGAASLYLHLGMLGPRRVDVNGDGAPTGLPTGLVDNPCSILDMTDLAFIDPVGTGYSRAMKGTDPSDFWNYDADIISVSKFIRLYTSLYARWGSPKYLSGESYGTVRAVGVADYLATQYDLYVNGAMLISSINDMNTALNGRDDSTDLSYVLTLPSYAAIAWYHGLLDEKYQSMLLEDYMTEVREFAGGDYQHALFKGTHLSQVELDDIAGGIAAYIGLKRKP